MTRVELVRAVGATQVPRNVVCELEFAATRDVADPWGEIGLELTVADPDGVERVVPAFWAGGRSWRLRYSSALEGVHRYRSRARVNDVGLDGLEGEVTVTGYEGANPLLLHGAPVVAQDPRFLAHADGTPFFWLSDSWLTSMTARFRWPETFQALADDRAEKGFTVVQMVGGLVPEIVPWSPEMESEGGQPWLDEGAGGINPAYWSVPDLKVDYLVSRGIVPCIVGAWGFWGSLMGRERVLEHWRYLVARYAAYPVMWHLAGEFDLVDAWETMVALRSGMGEFADFFPDGVASLKASAEAPDPQRRREQARLWEDASRMVGELDAFGRIRTVEALQSSSSEVFESRETFELDMLQTGHSGIGSVPMAMELLHASLAHGDKPVVDGESSFEGIFDSNWQDVQRFQFWSQVLSGAAGYSYGTMPITILNSKDDPLVPLSRVSMHFWEDAIDWIGSRHVGVGKRILDRLRWWELTPSPGAIEPHAGPHNWMSCYAATRPDGTTVVFLPGLVLRNLDARSKDAEPVEDTGPKLPFLEYSTLVFKQLRPGVAYRVTFVDPRSGDEYPASFTFGPTDGRHVLEASHFWSVPTGEDWLMVLHPQSVTP